MGLKKVLIILGFLFVVLGIIGIFLPVLPTTPFLLLALFLFSKSSNKWHNWLLNHKIFGKYLQDFIATRAISKKVKIISITTLWVTILISAICFVKIVIIKIFLIFIAVAVSIHILSFKTK
jgi:uncharacterized membrane protein YbaN (DUF454 family)